MSAKNTLATAALAGLLSAGFIASGVAQAAESTDTTTTSVEKTTSDHSVKEKHACKGQNSCKGKGADGKNSCKGKGSCATDGSKPAAQ